MIVRFDVLKVALVGEGVFGAVSRFVCSLAAVSFVGATDCGPFFVDL